MTELRRRRTLINKQIGLDDFIEEEILDYIMDDSPKSFKDKLSQSEIDLHMLTLFQSMKLHFKTEYDSKITVFLDCLQV